jgi:carbamoyltransferase
VYEHHACHAATAFFGSGWPELLTVTADGWGEDGSASFWRFDRGQFVRESSTPTIDSLGYFYGSITAALGFTPHRHEGKVLGLAAAGKENKKLEQLMGQLVSYDKNRQVFLGLMELGVYQPSFDNPILTQILGQYAREDVARAAQSRLERVVSEAVLSLVKGPTRVGLAGGIFSNVKLNQIVSELPSVAEVFVFPSMGDGGLSIGAAWLAYSEISGQRPEPLTTALLGPTYSHREILGAIEYTGLDYSYQPQISAVIAQLLAEGHPVVRVNGRMEFGPRALGNRSVLAPATDTSVVEYLNDRLGRSEFMPFAPACLGESMDDQFVRPFDRQHMTRYMTTTLDSRDVLQKQSPASVHLDGTARPQSVFASDYPQLHEVLTRYRELTGIPVAINTSFNMHEEPIVCDPPSALATFVTSRLPYMAFGNFLISNR